MLQFYKPNPIIIPKDSPLQIRFPRIHEIPSGEETKIDTATLFYDIFLRSKHQSSNRLRACFSESEERLISNVGNLPR